MHNKLWLFQIFLKLDELNSELQGHDMKSRVDSKPLAASVKKVAHPFDNSFITIEGVTATWDEVTIFLQT